VVVTDEKPPVGIDVTRPSIARVYDYWLGGKDNYGDDRRFAKRLLAVVPGAQAAARANKNFLARAVRFLVEEAGIRQVQCRDSGDLAGRGFAGLGQKRIRPWTLASGAT